MHAFFLQILLLLTMIQKMCCFLDSLLLFSPLAGPDERLTLSPLFRQSSLFLFFFFFYVCIFSPSPPGALHTASRASERLVRPSPPCASPERRLQTRSAVPDGAHRASSPLISHHTGDRIAFSFRERRRDERPPSATCQSDGISLRHPVIKVGLWGLF